MDFEDEELIVELWMGKAYEIPRGSITVGVLRSRLEKILAELPDDDVKISELFLGTEKGRQYLRYILEEGEPYDKS